MKPIVLVSSFVILATVNCLEDVSSFFFNLKANKTHINFSKVEEDKIKFVLFTRTYPNGYRLQRNNIRNLRNSSFDASSPTKFIIHGYINNYKSPFVQLLKNAYLSSGNYNVIAVDWSNYVFPFLVAAGSARGVGYLTGAMIIFLMDQGDLRLSDVHMIGHSLGAHVAGFASDKLPSKPARITGLDPAAPIFQDAPPSGRLGTEDAEFVDVIHTSIRLVGIAQNIGHADFYPAGGKHQPRCPSDIVEEVVGFCDHGQSYNYFAESIRNKNKFPAVKCNSLSDGLQRRCRGPKTALMGDAAPYRNPRGIYYVEESLLKRNNKPNQYFSAFRKSRKNSFFDFDFNFRLF